RAAARAVPADRRLSAARGPAARSGPADRGHRGPEGRVPEAGLRGLRLQLPPGVAAARRAERGAPRPDRLRGARAHGPVLSGPARGRAGGAAAAPQGNLPDLQRLHQRPAQWPGVGMLSAGPVLRRASRRGAAQARQGNDDGMSSPAMSSGPAPRLSREQAIAVGAACFALFAILGFATYLLPFFYDRSVTVLGSTPQPLTSVTAPSTLP